MKRVLILIKGLGRGGAEQLLASAAPHLDRERFKYEVSYLLPWKDALVRPLEQAGLPVRCLEGGRGPGWVRRLRALVRDRGIDLIHAHLPYAAVGARLGLGGSVPLVYTEHNVWGRYHPLTRWANLLTFPRNRHVFAVSEEVRKSIRYPAALGFLRMPPVETLHHGLDLARMETDEASDGVREEFRIPRETPLIGAVGNFKLHKGQEHLVRAMAIVRESIPDARLLLVGLGPRELDVRQEAARLGLDGAVTFAGFREDARRLMHSFDLFVQPSVYEGLPIALLEAMAAGRPVVATTAGGTPEVVRDGFDGLLVPPRDPEALARDIVRVLADGGLATRLGASAARRAAEFDIRKAVRRMEEVYEEILS